MNTTPMTPEEGVAKARKLAKEVMTKKSEIEEAMEDLVRKHIPEEDDRKVFEEACWSFAHHGFEQIVDIAEGRWTPVGSIWDVEIKRAERLLRMADNWKARQHNSGPSSKDPE